MNKLALWAGPEEINLPSTDFTDIISHSNNLILSEKKKNQIISAFGIQAYHMGAEYVWRYAMTSLKEAIATLGMKFVGEMLDREDIDEFSAPDTALTDYTAIALADQLGIVGKTGALKLRHAQELINHFFSKDCEEELGPDDALSIVSSCVKYILGHRQISVAEDFTKFRNRLQNETLAKDDPQLAMLTNSAIFYIRTVINILLANIKGKKGATLEHSINNLNVILPQSWDKITEKDKWNVGMTYRDVVTDGNETASVGMKKALLKVKGFDYVPESLRSNTFRKAAQSVIDTHFAFNNFYNEPAVVRSLRSLGTTIPAPALQECMEAYLLVYIGNYYGVSEMAAPIARGELLSLPQEAWRLFFNNILPKDELILNNISTQTQFTRLSNLLKEMGIDMEGEIHEGISRKLYQAIHKGKYENFKSLKRRIFSEM